MCASNSISTRMVRPGDSVRAVRVGPGGSGFKQGGPSGAVRTMVRVVTAWWWGWSGHGPGGPRWSQRAKISGWSMSRRSGRSGAVSVGLVWCSRFSGFKSCRPDSLGRSGPVRAGWIRARWSGLWPGRAVAGRWATAPGERGMPGIL